MSKNIRIQVNFGNVSEYGYSAPSLNIDLPGAEPDNVDARAHNANMLASAAAIVNDFTCAAADLGPAFGYDDIFDDDGDDDDGDDGDDDDSDKGRGSGPGGHNGGSGGGNSDDDDDDDDGDIDPRDLTLGQIFPDVSDDEPPTK